HGHRPGDRDTRPGERHRPRARRDGPHRRRPAGPLRPSGPGGLMRVVIAGAGSVGRSIARELLAHGHTVTLIDRQPGAMRIASVADAEWILADACEISSLAGAGVEECDVVVAATGDDK